MTDPRVARALILLAAGAEEMETVIVADVLRRGGIDVVIAGVDGPGVVECSRGVRVAPDAALADVGGEFDWIVLPGGAPGSRRLAESAAVGRWLTGQQARGGGIAAICAAPIALVAHGVGMGAARTSHPSVRDRVAAAGPYREDAVVADGMLVTSRGPGTAFEFALELVARMRGADVAAGLREPMMLGPNPPA